LTTIPKPALAQTSQPMPRITSSELSFSSSAFAGNFSNADTIVVSKTPIDPLLEGPNFQVDGSDHLLYAPKPVVPLRAKQLGLSGNVAAQWEVNELGQVENVKILKSSNAIFDKGVIQALKQYRFKPYADSSGKLIRVTLTKEFQIEVH
jgi:TonB family protein